MPPDYPERLTAAREWLARARSNLIRAEQVRPDGVFREDLCFDMQQATEKSIKAVLGAKGIEFPFTHHVEHLIAIALENGIDWPSALNSAAALTVFAVQARYPGRLMQLTEADVEKARDIAKNVFRWAEGILNKSP